MPVELYSTMTTCRGLGEAKPAGTLSTYREFRSAEQPETKRYR
jgi:hypothetical protein